VKYCEVELRHGEIAPVDSVRSGSGMTSSGSTRYLVPRPSQASQAPYGELNEKLRGWRLVRVAGRRNQLHLGHALGQLQRRLERVGEPPLEPVALHETVDHHMDGVLLVAGETLLPLEELGDVDGLAVDDGPHVALGR
jgi:hypothetical protein